MPFIAGIALIAIAAVAWLLLLIHECAICCSLLFSHHEF